MILAVGIDIVEVARIRRLYETYGERFFARLYSPDEIMLISLSGDARDKKAAGRFAAKEAVMKALGQFFDSGVFLRDIEILDRGGTVTVRLPQRLHADLRGNSIVVSISEEETIALAMAMILNEA
jgi:holo-[acyl-carrier protein] synthase